MIDRNAFEENTDLSNLLFFGHYQPGDGSFNFKSVKRPDKKKDRTSVREDGLFEVVHLQLEAFRTMILQENQD